MTVLRIMVPFLLLLTGTAPAFGEDPASGGEPALSGGCGAGEPDAVLWDGSGDPPRLRALLTARGGTFACLEMIHDQYHQAGEELPEGVPGWLSGDGPLHLISTWSTRYLPFQLVLLGGEEAATGPKVVRTLRDPGPVDGAVPGGAATWKKGAPVEADLRTVYAADPVYTRVSRPGDAEAVYVWPDPARDASEIFVERRLQPLDDYRIRLTVTVYNFGAAAVALQPALEVHGWEPPGSSKGGIFSPPPDVLEALCLAGADLNRAPAADLAEDGVMNPTGEASWIGVGGRYFLLAAIARQVPRPGCQLYGEPNGVLTARLSRERMELAGVPPEVSCVPAWFAGPGRILCDDLAEGLGLSTGDLASPAAVERALKAHADLPGVELERVRHFLKGDGRETWVFELYAGPKDITFLKKPDAGIEDSIDFWIVGFLARPMLHVLKWCHAVVPSWTLAIILLTVLVKLLLLPLTQKSFSQMQRMSSLKPQMDELREKYGKDKNRLNQEMMNLYKREKVNPLGGCLPMLLQMPIWIALYRTIYSSAELYQAPMGLWIQDLSAPDPWFVMPLVLGVLMFFQQKMTPTATDSQQAKMMLYVMPVMFTVFMLFLPAGLNLYILVNTLLSLAQQVYLKRRYAAPAASAAKA